MPVRLFSFSRPLPFFRVLLNLSLQSSSFEIANINNEKYNSEVGPKNIRPTGDLKLKNVRYYSIFLENFNFSFFFMSTYVRKTKCKCMVLSKKHLYSLHSTVTVRFPEIVQILNTGKLATQLPFTKYKSKTRH